jgi:hypothetical protein
MSVISQNVEELSWRARCVDQVHRALDAAESAQKHAAAVSHDVRQVAGVIAVGGALAPQVPLRRQPRTRAP